MSKGADNKQEAIKNRRLSILNDLLEKPYSEDELQEKYSIERKTLKNDISALVSDGFDIPRYSKKNGGYALSDIQKELIRSKIESAGSEVITTEKLRNSDIQKTIILLLLQQSKNYMDINELITQYMKYFDVNEVGDHKKKNSISNRVRNALEDETTGLISTGLVEKKENKYRITKQSPIYLVLSEEELMDIISAIETYGQTYILKDKLMKIHQKLQAVLYKNTESVSNGGFIVVGNVVNRNNNINRLLSIFEKIPYDKYGIEFNYNNKNIRFMTGLVVYVSNKDKLYMIGKTKRDKNKIIDVEKISGEIFVLKEVQNDIYKDDYYLDIYEEMFSISTEPLEHVRVEFDIYGNILKKFERLRDERKNASIIISADKKMGIYEDNIRGIADFAKYLRRYGRSVRVLEPESLRKEMRNSITRLEQRYMEEGLYE